MAKVLTEEQWQVHRNRKKSKVIEELLKSQDEHKNVSGDVRKTREKLPIYDMRQEIIRQIEERQIIIIEGKHVDIFKLADRMRSMPTNGASKNRVVFVCLCFCLTFAI